MLHRKHDQRPEEVVHPSYLMSSVAPLPSESVKAVVATRKHESFFEWYYMILGLVALLPLFLYDHYNLEGTVLEASLRTDQVKFVFAASVAACFPLLLELAMDISLPFPVSNVFARLMVASAIIVPACAFIGLADNPHIATIFAIVSSSQLILGYERF